MANKRVFVAFAAEDAYGRDFLRGQAKNKNSPFEFVDMSIKEPFDEKWKTQCRTKIRGCHGVIALLSKKTWNADGARWEMSCANEEKKPLLGVHIHKDDKGAIPPGSLLTPAHARGRSHTAAPEHVSGAG